VGSRRLAASKVIVARLSAIEELAGMTILCSDKTGECSGGWCCFFPSRPVSLRTLRLERRGGLSFVIWSSQCRGFLLTSLWYVPICCA
jgi:hypothetical protein